VSSGTYGDPTHYRIGSEPSRAKRVLKEGDTVISSVRPNLKAFFFCQNMPENAVASTGFAVLSPIKIDTRFLYYLTTNDNYIEYLVKSCTGSAYPAFNTRVIEDSIVRIPESIEEQRAIASILSALDDKIELNLQMNKTLEEMAMALYKHWFIDFGPFKDGKFVESELGMIPEGWEVKKLNQISISHNKLRKPISTREREKIKGNYPYYGATKILDYIDHFNLNGEYILLAEDGTVKTEKDTPFLQFIQGKFCVSNHAHILSGMNCYGNNFLFLALSNTNVLPFITGAVQLKINKQNLDQMQFIVGSEVKMLEFESKVKPLFAKMKSNEFENQNLISQRDSLLPKLISGEISVDQNFE
jgi:type I restriction enzyme S subunit